MVVLTVRNVPDEMHRALRLRAAMNGRSTEAEVREILENVVKPEQRIRMGDALAERGRQSGRPMMISLWLASDGHRRSR